MRIGYLGPALVGVMLLAGCGAEDSAVPGQVASSGKLETELADVPDAVLTAALAARPDLEITETEYETRDGREYYDVGGMLPDGSEIELDMMLDGDTWRIVEVQRDIEFDTVPEPAAAALAAAAAGFSPARIIESDQGDGVVVYEFFGPGDSASAIKHEVKLENGEAEYLTEEWAH